MPKINLAQETVRSQVLARRRRVLYGVSVGVLLVAVGGFGLVFFLTKRAEAATEVVRREVAQLQAELNARRDDVRKIVLFRERLAGLATVLGGHVRWSRFLTEIERLVIPSARLSALEGSVADGHVTVAVRVPSVDAAADLVASLENRGEQGTPFSQVTVKSVLTATGPGTPEGGEAASAFDMVVEFQASQGAFRAAEEGGGQPPAARVSAPAVQGAAAPLPGAVGEPPAAVPDVARVPPTI